MIDATGEQRCCLPRIWVQIFGRRVRSFQFFGGLGIALAVALSTTLAALSGLSPVVMAVISVVAVLTLFTLVAITILISGEERIVYFHHEIAVVAITTVLLKILGQPILPFLDILILGLGVFLACGRSGCLMAGCCHGLPHRWGVNYGLEHSRDGFPACLVGARLFPIQAIEAAYVACTVLAGVCLFLAEHRPGDIVSLYAVAYGVGRFSFEFARGDSERSYYVGFSQAQWISVIQTGSVASAAACGWLPSHTWQIAAAGMLGIAVAAITLRRGFRRGDDHRLFQPCHIYELAQAIDTAIDPGCGGAGAESPRVITTSLGIQITAGVIGVDGSVVYHYALSHRTRSLSDRTGRRVARLVSLLEYPDSRSRIIKGRGGTFHLLIEPSNGTHNFESRLLERLDKFHTMETAREATVFAS
jgi:hypothetical protein